MRYVLRISRDRGRLFHGIAGSHVAVAGRLIGGFMASGQRAEVKGFRDFAAHAFARELKTMGVVDEAVQDGVS